MPSIVDKLKSIKPDVPDPMLTASKDDPSQMYLLKQASVLDQQNVIIGGVLEKVLDEVKSTNGRVTYMEPRVERHEQFVQDAALHSKEGKWRLEIVWMPALFVGLQIIAHKLGYL